MSIGRILSYHFYLILPNILIIIIINIFLLPKAQTYSAESLHRYHRKLLILAIILSFFDYSSISYKGVLSSFAILDNQHITARETPTLAVPSSPPIKTSFFQVSIHYSDRMIWFFSIVREGTSNRIQIGLNFSCFSLFQILT